MAEKILFLGQGSEKDPGFRDVFVEGLPYKGFMKERGIRVLEGYVESCHGCYDLMSKYSMQLQSLVENGNRVVAVLQGGLLFGLPSIQATQTTFPIISCPLDYVAYTAFMVPSGHAAIATVGVDGGRIDQQKAKALSLAERILNLENMAVNVFTNNDESEEKLRSKLNDLRVWNYKGGGEGALSLVYGVDEMRRIPQNSFAIRSDSDENVHDWEYLRKAEHRHHLGDWNEVPAMQVRGLDNLAIFAAKIISLQRAEIILPLLKEIARIKRESYPKMSVSHELQGAS